MKQTKIIICASIFIALLALYFFKAPSSFDEGALPDSISFSKKAYFDPEILKKYTSSRPLPPQILPLNKNHYKDLIKKTKVKKMPGEDDFNRTDFVLNLSDHLLFDDYKITRNLFQYHEHVKMYSHSFNIWKGDYMHSIRIYICENPVEAQKFFGKRENGHSNALGIGDASYYGYRYVHFVDRNIYCRVKRTRTKEARLREAKDPRIIQHVMVPIARQISAAINQTSLGDVDNDFYQKEIESRRKKPKIAAVKKDVILPPGD